MCLRRLEFSPETSDKNAVQEFHLWTVSIPVIRYGMAGIKDVRKWEKVLERYLAEDNPQQKKNLMFGLAQAQNSPLPPPRTKEDVSRDF